MAMINDLDCVGVQTQRVDLASTSAYCVYLQIRPEASGAALGRVRQPAAPPPFILSGEARLSPPPRCRLILLRAERKSMARDAFGGPLACPIAHQSVGFGYGGAVSGTAAP